MESKQNQGCAPAGAPMNNKSAQTAAKPEDKEKKAGMSTAAKVGLGAAAGGAAAFAATAAATGIGFEGEDDGDVTVIDEFLSDAKEVAENLGHAPGVDDTIHEVTVIDDDEIVDENVTVVDPNTVSLEPIVDHTNGTDVVEIEPIFDDENVVPEIEPEIDPFVMEDDMLFDDVDSFEDLAQDSTPIDDIF